MAARDAPVSVPLERADAEALAAIARVGLAVDDVLGEISHTDTAERGLNAVSAAVGRRGAKLTANMARIEAKALERVASDGLKIAGALELAKPIDLAAAMRGLDALRSAAR